MGCEWSLLAHITADHSFTAETRIHKFVYEGTTGGPGSSIHSPDQRVPGGTATEVMLASTDLPHDVEVRLLGEDVVLHPNTRRMLSGTSTSKLALQLSGAQCPTQFRIVLTVWYV
jgi:hypothetical protein